MAFRKIVNGAPVVQGATTSDTVTTLVDTAVANLVDSAPATLDTLNELAAALGDDSNFATTVANSLGAINSSISGINSSLSGKQDTVSGVSNTEISYLDGVTSAIQTQLNSKAGTSSPTFTGTVNASDISVTNGVSADYVSTSSYVSSGRFFGRPANSASSSMSASYLGYRGLPQLVQTTGNIILGTDTSSYGPGETIYSTASRTITIPANSSYPFEIGTTFVFISGSGATTTIAINSDTLILAKDGTTGTRTLAAHGIATAIKVAATTWYISGNGLT